MWWHIVYLGLEYKKVWQSANWGKWVHSFLLLIFICHYPAASHSQNYHRHISGGCQHHHHLFPIITCWDMRDQKQPASVLAFHLPLKTFSGTVLPWSANETIRAANTGHGNNHTKAVKDIIVLKIFLNVAHPSLLWTKRFCCFFLVFLKYRFNVLWCDYQIYTYVWYMSVALQLQAMLIMTLYVTC
jgi:hypothetical protein